MRFPAQRAFHFLLMMTLTSSLCASFTVLLGGCAYSIGTSERRMPEGYKLVAVPVFKNQSHEVGAEVAFTNAMIREMERHQIAHVVPKADAQVVLDGVIDSIQYIVSNQVNDSSLPRSTILNIEYRIVVGVTLRLKRASDGVNIWTESFNAERSYQAPKIGLEGLNSANSLYNDSARHDNLSAMATDLMVEAHSRLTENF
ncbi:MAG: hypothetical protein JNJ49_10670 [Bdellovibrionaceae bacterium]|nr:hypothetical protein [Pseudobdellovibrionaceae bacterium]